MNTARTIGLIVAVVVLTTVGATAGLVLIIGLLRALAIATAIIMVAVGLYLAVVRPWHSRWGTIGDEAERSLPGDDLVTDASVSTRAIAIAAPPEDVWPWLLQLGYGRGGWYSYDWIDNDGRPSATSIWPDLQDLAVGDRIAMTPDMGFVVQSIDHGHDLLSLSDDGTTSWCLHLEPTDDGHARLLSRFRAHFVLTPASALWIALADPGVFIMERKMLKGIAARAETRFDAVVTTDDPPSR